MDRVRFGRALGYGARHAAKTVMAAAEAAAAPDPSQGESPVTPRRPKVIPPVHTARVAEVVTAARQGAAGARVASGGLVAPVRRFSAVLWLEVTGAFFAVMAMTFGAAVWRFRTGFQSGTETAAQHRAWTFAALLLLFGYFSVSSFLRASRRGRR